METKTLMESIRFNIETALNDAKSLPEEGDYEEVSYFYKQSLIEAIENVRKML